MRYPPPNPTAEKAIGRASHARHGRLPAARDQLERRVRTAVARGDGAGLRLLAAHLSKADR